MRKAVLLLAALLAPHAHAQDCVPTTSTPDVDTGTPSEARYYVIQESYEPSGWIYIWIYEESNGRDGLQRQDEVKDDTCGGPEYGGIEGDTIVF